MPAAGPPVKPNPLGLGGGLSGVGASRPHPKGEPSCRASNSAIGGGVEGGRVGEALRAGLLGGQVPGPGVLQDDRRSECLARRLTGAVPGRRGVRPGGRAGIQRLLLCGQLRGRVRNRPRLQPSHSPGNRPSGALTGDPASHLADVLPSLPKLPAPRHAYGQSLGGSIDVVKTLEVAEEHFLDHGRGFLLSAGGSSLMNKCSPSKDRGVRRPSAVIVRASLAAWPGYRALRKLSPSAPNRRRIR